MSSADSKRYDERGAFSTQELEYMFHMVKFTRKYLEIKGGYFPGLDRVCNEIEAKLKDILSRCTPCL
jgi:hypothetical protein